MPFNSNPFRIPVQLFHIYFVNFMIPALPRHLPSWPQPFLPSVCKNTNNFYSKSPSHPPSFPPARPWQLLNDNFTDSFFTWVEWGGLAASQELCVRQSSAGDLNNRKISGFRGGCHYTLQLQTFECVNKWLKIIFSDLIAKQTVDHLNKMLGQSKLLVIKQPVRIRVS